MPVPLTLTSMFPTIATASEWMRVVRPGDCRGYRANSQLIREEEQAPTARLFAGWAGTTRILLDGRRQILHLVLPGDPLVAFAPPNGQAVLQVTALTPVLIAPSRPIDVAEQARRTAVAFWCMQNQICRLGRQSAYERIAHLFAELRDRMAASGRCDGDSFEMPLTQDSLADVLGLTSVHVNRTLQQLRRDGLVRLVDRTLTLTDRPALERVAEYRPLLRE